MPTIGMDNNLFIEELPEKKQPGTHVRRINGKELNDDEMIEYYTSLVKKYGNKLTAKWVYGMVICSKKGVAKYSWNKDQFLFYRQTMRKKKSGYPLDSITIVPEFDKYLVELTDEEKKEYRKQDNIDTITEFITNNI